MNIGARIRKYFSREYQIEKLVKEIFKHAIVWKKYSKLVAYNVKEYNTFIYNEKMLNAKLGDFVDIYALKTNLKSDTVLMVEDKDTIYILKLTKTGEERNLVIAIELYVKENEKEEPIGRYTLTRLE